MILQLNRLIELRPTARRQCRPHFIDGSIRRAEAEPVEGIDLRDPQWRGIQRRQMLAIDDLDDTPKIGVGGELLADRWIAQAKAEGTKPLPLRGGKLSSLRSLHEKERAASGNQHCGRDKQRANFAVRPLTFRSDAATPNFFEPAASPNQTEVAMKQQEPADRYRVAARSAPLAPASPIPLLR